MNFFGSIRIEFGKPKTASKTRARRVTRTESGCTEVVDYVLTKRKSMRRLLLSVKPTGEVRLSVPNSATLAEADEMVLKHFDWIKEMQAKTVETVTFVPQGGSVIPFRGEEAVIRLEARRSGIERERNGWVIYLSLPADAAPELVKQRLKTALKNEARQVIAEQLARMLSRTSEKPRLWRLSSAKGRWGSCTADGALRFAWRLIFLPDDLIGYVAAHELAHLTEFNHSPAFWAQCREIDPETDRHRAVLKAWPKAKIPSLD